MILTVFNRDKAETTIPDFKHIMISITDPYDSEAKLIETPNRLDLLRLSFHDVDDLIYSKSLIPFTEEIAKEILHFVHVNLHRVASEQELDNFQIIVHCEAGISRSAAVAAALSKIYNGSDEYFFKKYLPNSLIYSTILKAYGRDLETN